MDNSFIGFCKDILLNPSFDYFLYFKNSGIEETTFENIWKTINCYNHCKDMKQNPFQWINHKNFIEFKHKLMVDKKYGTKSKVKEIDTSIPYIDDLSEAQIEILKTKKIVTADPGKLYLLYMMDDEGNELKYSCKQRDTESLAKRNRRIKQTNKKRSVLNHEVNKSCPTL